MLNEKCNDNGYKHEHYAKLNAEQNICKTI